MRYEVITADDKTVVNWTSSGAEAAAWVKKYKSYYKAPLRVVKRPETPKELLSRPEFLRIPGADYCCDARFRLDEPDKIFIIDGESIKVIPFLNWLNTAFHGPGTRGDCEALWYGVQIKFAKTAEEIIDVYKKGPPSCTVDDAKKRGLNAKNKHPLAVIGDSDIQVAYNLSKDGTVVTWRCLVWPEKKIRHYSYTNNGQELGDLCVKALEAMGYGNASMDHKAWKGAKIKRIPLVENPERFLIPALDIIYNLCYLVSDDREALYLGELPNMKRRKCNCHLGYCY